MERIHGIPPRAFLFFRHVCKASLYAHMWQFLLMESGAAPNMLDKNDQTVCPEPDVRAPQLPDAATLQALHFACIGGYLDVCGKLIEQKAYVEVASAVLDTASFTLLYGRSTHCLTCSHSTLQR